MNTTMASTVSGTLQKSNTNSFFLSFHNKSDLADDLFRDCPKFKGRDVVLLQLMIGVENYLLVELIYKP